MPPCPLYLVQSIKHASLIHAREALYLLGYMPTLYFMHINRNWRNLALSWNEVKRAASTNLQALHLHWEKLLRSMCLWSTLCISPLSIQNQKSMKTLVRKVPSRQLSQWHLLCVAKAWKQGAQVIRSFPSSLFFRENRQYSLRHMPPEGTLSNGIRGLERWLNTDLAGDLRKPSTHIQCLVTACHSNSRGIQKPLASMGNTFTHPSSHIHT